MFFNIKGVRYGFVILILHNQFSSLCCALSGTFLFICSLCSRFPSCFAVFIDFYLKVENVFVDIGKIAPAFGNRQATQYDDKIAI